MANQYEVLGKAPELKIYKNFRDQTYIYRLKI